MRIGVAPRRIWIAWLVGIVAIGGSLAAAEQARAAGATLTATNVTYDPPSGPSDPACNAPLPSKSGSGSATYTAADGTYKGTFEWTMPATITAGATAQLKVTAQTFSNGGYTASMAFKVPFEFGTNAGARQQIDASVPAGAPGSDTEQETYRFTPTREYVAGERLYARVEFGCASVIYEYTGIAQSGPPSACASGAAAMLASSGGSDCATRSIAAPAPGGSARVSSPVAFGRSDRTAAVTVSSTSGALSGTTVVGEGGSSHGKVLGDAVAACWLIGPEALTGSDARLTRITARDSFRKLWAEAQDDPRKALRVCIALALAIQGAVAQGDASAAQAGCATRRIVLRGRVRKHKTVALKRVKTKPRGAVRYRCTVPGSGRIRMTVEGSLRRQLGTRLDLGVVRSSHAPAGASGLVFGFRRG